MNHPTTFTVFLSASRDKLRTNKTATGLATMDIKKAEKSLRNNLKLNHGWWGKIVKNLPDGRKDCFKGFENIDGRLFPRNNL